MGDSDSKLFNTISLKSTRVCDANVGGGVGTRAAVCSLRKARGMGNIRRLFLARTGIYLRVG